MKDLSNSSFSKIRHKSFDLLAPFWPKEQLFIPKETSKETLIENVKAIEKQELPSNEFLIVSSPKEYLPLYYSQNVYNILGYSTDELLRFRSFAFFKLSSISHIQYLYNVQKFVSSFIKLNKEKQFKAQIFKANIAGMKLKTKKGLEKFFLMVCQYKVGKNFEMHDTVVTRFIDISHLYSSKNYWAIYEATNDKAEHLTQTYFNNIKSIDSFFNSNEKAILKLTSEGFSGEEIQDLLKMKKPNFEKNCANMLSIAGAKDFSALIQLFSYCGHLK